MNLYNILCSDEKNEAERARLQKSSSNTSNGSNDNNIREEHQSLLYSNLLKSHILDDVENYDNTALQPKAAGILPKRVVGMPSAVGAASETSAIPSVLGVKKVFCFSADKKNSENTNAYRYDFDDVVTNRVSSVATYRKINKLPYKVLDAPNLQDDFYLNLLDWSSSNTISVGLEDSVYIWSACTCKVSKVCEMPENETVASVSWSQQGTHLAVGNSYGEIQIYDVIKNKLVRTFGGHNGRVGSLSWNGYFLASGSRDRSILVHDVRNRNDYEFRYAGHKQEICGLKWSCDEQYLASGGNDNKVFVWSLKNQNELTRFSQHTAAVKALGWSPHQHHILATGGGTADRCIRFWNVQTLSMVDCVDTGSQVCNLTYSKTVNEIVSTHGYSLNQIIVWDYPCMKKVATLTGHTFRVLYLAMSPCGQNIVTGAGDETLRFWNIFPSAKTKADGLFSKSTITPSNMDLR
jgi:cell division cycle 20-like protein 1 (cofactor of APC complex)